MLARSEVSKNTPYGHCPHYCSRQHRIRCLLYGIQRDVMRDSVSTCPLQQAYRDRNGSIA